MACDKLSGGEASKGGGGGGCRQGAGNWGCAVHRDLGTVEDVSDEHLLPLVAHDTGNTAQSWGFKFSACPSLSWLLRGQGKVVREASGGAPHTFSSWEKLPCFSSECGVSA